MADSKARSERPLSPHLQIYKPAMTMIMSIVHRITGSALYFGTLLLVVWLVSAATSASAFETVHGVMTSWFGKLVMFGFSWALLHHMLGGIRHFIWDTGRGYGAEHRSFLAHATLAGSIALTVLVWAIAFAVR